MNYSGKYKDTIYAVDKSGDPNHPKYDPDVPLGIVGRYGRAPDQDQFKEVMDYVFTANLIPHDVCDKILDILDTISDEWENHNWYEMIKGSPQETYAAKSDQSSASNECMMMFPGTNIPENHPVKEELDEILIPYIEKALAMYEQKYSCIEMDNSGTVTPLGDNYFTIRYQLYKDGTMMKIHYDHNHSLFHSCENHDKAIPTLTICGYLTQQGVDHEGGDVRIRGNVIPVNKGDMVIFPCSFMFPHEVTPVTKTMGKTRTMFSSWFW